MYEHEHITHMCIIAVKQNIDGIQLFCTWMSLYYCIKNSLHIQVMDWQSCFSELVFSLLPVSLCCCHVCLRSTLLSIHSPPLAASCSTPKPVAKLKRQPGWERWYPPANKRLLCTTCSLSVSTARCPPSSSQDLLLGTDKQRRRIKVPQPDSQSVYWCYFGTCVGVFPVLVCLLVYTPDEHMVLEINFMVFN